MEYEVGVKRCRSSIWGSVIGELSRVHRFHNVVAPARAFQLFSALRMRLRCASYHIKD